MVKQLFIRKIAYELLETLRSDMPLIQVVVGPRQVGKSWASQWIAESLGIKYFYLTADNPTPLSPDWIESQWNIALGSSDNQEVLLVIDEIQKIAGWSEIVKKLWDEAQRKKQKIKVLILGSSALLLQAGLTESLSGRFFLHKFQHWSYTECKAAFGWSINHWLTFGGYPGAAKFINEHEIWRRYISDSLIETVLARDVLQLQVVKKPALLRNLFGLVTTYPAQILSYNKMLGQLQDAGNTTTLAHYLKLLEGAFLVSGLELFSRGQIRKRGSSPKLVAWNNALINAPSTRNLSTLSTDPTWWGRVVENAVGACLLNQLNSFPWDITYWNDGTYEVDYVVSNQERIFAIEVKSGRTGKLSGLKKFKERYPKAKCLVVGADSLTLEYFFSNSVQNTLV